MITAAALLVLVALGLFVWGIVAAATALYWACVAVSAVAAVLLVIAFVRMRTAAPAGAPAPAQDRAAVPDEPTPPGGAAAPAGRGETVAAAAPATGTGEAGHAADYAPTGPGSPVVDGNDPAPDDGPGHEPVELPAHRADEPTGEQPGHRPDHRVGDLPAGALHDGPPTADGAADPPVEEVEVTDLLLVVDLHDDVLVVDEHPRYHLDGCSWLAGRTTIPLPVDEARTDGFTPCGGCAPDHHLAERERGRRAGREAP